MKKRILSLALAVLIIVAAVPGVTVPAYAAAITFSGGTGTANDPYIITTAEQLVELTQLTIAHHPKNTWPDEIRYNQRHYKLGNDIDLSAYGKDWDNGFGSKGWIPILAFSGSFDGDGYEIKGLYVNGEIKNGMFLDSGLFNNLYSQGTVKNLGVVDVDVGSDRVRNVDGKMTYVGEVGGVAGFITENSSIVNCYVTGTFSKGGYVGGVAGRVEGNGSVIDCDMMGTVSGDGITGGVVGRIMGNGSVVINCNMAGTVSGDRNVGGVAGVVTDSGSIVNCNMEGTVSGNGNVGGVAGFVGSSGSIINCNMAGTVEYSRFSVGGVAGTVTASGSIINCSMEGTVSGEGYVGGVVGSVVAPGEGSNITIEACYATSNVNGGGSLGGVAGVIMVSAGSVRMTNCYATGAVSGDGGDIGGLIGYVEVNQNGSISVTDCYATGAVSGDQFVGGIVGRYNNNNVMIMKNCAALNPTVTAEYHAGRVAGVWTSRVIDGETTSPAIHDPLDNRALADMVVTADPTEYAYAYDGEDMTMQQARTASFWTTDTETWTGWDTDIWLIEDGKLPVLKAFADVTEAPNLDTATDADWARNGINGAYAKGFIPTDLQNNYRNIITRQEFCRMAVKWVEYRTGKTIDAVLDERGDPEKAGHTFSDTTDADILAAYRLGITNGTLAPAAGKPGTFDPNGQFNREQAATMIMNACKVIGMNTDAPPASDFTDMDAASVWTVDGINFCRAEGIMSGTSTDPSKPTFSPKGTYTREASIVTFNNIK